MNTILERNLLALSGSNSRLSQEVSAIAAGGQVRFMPSKTGKLVPILQIQDHDLPLHSRFDPLKEGERNRDMYANAGFLVVLGLGAGYHLIPLLEKSTINAFLIIEKDLALLRCILEKIDMTQILLDLRVKILIDADTDEVKNYLLKYYLPALAGNLKTLTLQSRLNLEKEYFTGIYNSINEVISQIADDFTVQSKFGKKWYVNSLVNLRLAQESTVILKPVSKIMITGAGPSLENQIDEIKAIRESHFMIASDTSLPYILKQSVIPDLVLSIDCQQISYLHFLCDYPRQIPLVLDLASPPVLTRISDRVLFFTSGHPFSRYVAQNLRAFPQIDTSGGNVSHAALSLATKLGASEIKLFGIDFSFPFGKTYTRGTYLYSYFDNLTSKINSLENHFTHFLFHTNSIEKTRIKGGLLYTTKPMLNYKRRLERAIKEIPIPVRQMNGTGLRLNIEQVITPPPPSFPELFSQGKPWLDWRAFLLRYKKGLIALKKPFEPYPAYLEELSYPEKTILSTLLPAATAIREEIGDNLTASNLIEKTRKWSLSKIKQYLR